MAVPALAVGGVKVLSGIVSGAEAKRVEAHITDRVAKYQSLPTEQLLAIINTYGGEMGEAATRVLNSRAASPQNIPTGPTNSTLPPSPVAADVFGGFDSKTILIGAAALIVLILILKK